MFITVNGIKLYYEVSGKGSPVILLHGNGESHKIFDVLTPRLSAEFTCYCIDSRCHGKSGKGALTYDNMAADVAAFIDALHLEKPSVIGFSDGGILALLLGINYGDKIGNLIALGPNATPDGLQPKFLKTLKYIYKITRSKKIGLLLREPNISAAQLSTISAPTAIVGGSRDLITTDHLRYIADTVPHARLEILQGETHTGYVIHSPRLYDVVRKHL